MQKALHAAAVAILMSFSADAASAEPTLVGDPFVANGYTTGAQSRATVCGTGGGGFVIAWGDFPYGYQYPPPLGADDGDGSGVFARRFDSGGNPTGTDFQVNTYTTASQAFPSAACMSGGNFVIAWRSDQTYTYPVGFSGKNGLFAQVFNGAGAPVGTELQFDDPQNPSSVGDVNVCSSATDGFLGLWHLSGMPLQGRRFDSTGQALGTVFSVGQTPNPGVTSCCTTPTGFVVAYDGPQGYGSGQDYVDVFAQRLADDGSSLGTEFQVNSDTFGYQRSSNVGCGPSGEFVIAWGSTPPYGYPSQDGGYGTGSGVFAQRFDAAGAPVGTEFQVNTSVDSNEESPSVAYDASGNFLVTWDKRNFAGTAVDAQAFAPNGIPLGTEFRMANIHGGVNRQYHNTLAPVGGGQFIVAWNALDIAVNIDVVAERVSLGGAPPTTTTTMGTGTTTTTMGGGGGVCADPVDPLAMVLAAVPRTVTATDALSVLQTAVGQTVCDLCVCDVNNSGGVTATDALIVLQLAVGQPVMANCPPCT